MTEAYSGRCKREPSSFVLRHSFVIGILSFVIPPHGVRGVTVCMRLCESRGGGFNSPRTPFFLDWRFMMVSAVLNRPTLVLNRSWQPVGVAPVSRSLVLLWNDNARVVDPQDYRLYTWADWAELIPHEHEPFIQAVRMPLRVPEAVALTHYDRLPTNAVTFSRRNIYKRDRYTCHYFGAPPGPEALTVHPLTPRAHGPT